MKNNYRMTKFIKTLIEKLYRLEDRFGHVQTQKWNHQSVFKYRLNELIILSQCCRIYHRIYYYVLHTSSYLFQYKHFYPRNFSIFRKSQQWTGENNSTYIKSRPLDQQFKHYQTSQTMCIYKERQILSSLFQKQNDVILKFLYGGTASCCSRISKSSKINHQNLIVFFRKMISDRIKSTRMLSKSMNDANSSGRIRRRKLGVIKSNLLLLSIEVSFKDTVVLLLGLSYKFLVHLNKQQEK